MNKLKYIILGLVLGSSIVFGRTIVDTILKLGNGTDVDIKLEAELGKGVANPALNYDSTNAKWQFCNEGDACADMGSGGGGGVPLLGKGSLLTSDGANNGEFTACANDELIVWDTAEVAGFKCAAAPSGGGSALYEVASGDNSYVVGSVTNTGLVSLDLTALTKTITAVSSKPILLSFLNYFRIKGDNDDTVCQIRVFKNSVSTSSTDPVISFKYTTAVPFQVDVPMPDYIDESTILAGDSITYTFTMRAIRGECSWLGISPRTVLIQQGL